MFFVSVEVSCRYFFHASDDRQQTSEYDQAETDEDMDKEDVSLPTGSTVEDMAAEQESVGDVDASLADWLVVDAAISGEDRSETESETDADSVNEDVKDEGEEWISVEPEVCIGSQTSSCLLIAVCARRMLLMKWDCRYCVSPWYSGMLLIIQRMMSAWGRTEQENMILG